MQRGGIYAVFVRVVEEGLTLNPHDGIERELVMVAVKLCGFLHFLLFILNQRLVILHSFALIS